MNLDEAFITITKLEGPQEGHYYYMMIGWQPNGFDMFLHLDNVIWKGRFPRARIIEFSKNLNLSEAEYYKSIRRCLTGRRPDYFIELNNGFFYWKRRSGDNAIIEGFLPVEVVSGILQPNIADILIALNKHLNQKNSEVKSEYETVLSEFKKCIADTEEFLNLKMEMEKSLSEKFLNLINIKQCELDIKPEELSPETVEKNNKTVQFNLLKQTMEDLVYSTQGTTIEYREYN